MIPLQLDQLLGLVRDLAQPAGHLVEVLANLPASARWSWWWWWQQSKFFFEDRCLLKIVHLFHVLFSSSWYLIRPSRRSSVLILRCDKSLKRAWTVNNPCFQLDYLKKIWEMEPCEHLLIQFLAVKPKQVQYHFLMMFVLKKRKRKEFGESLQMKMESDLDHRLLTFLMWLISSRRSAYLVICS